MLFLKLSGCCFFFVQILPSQRDFPCEFILTLQPNFTNLTLLFFSFYHELILLSNMLHTFSLHIMLSFIFCYWNVRPTKVQISTHCAHWLYPEHLRTGLRMSCGRCSVNICWINECISKETKEKWINRVCLSYLLLENPFVETSKEILSPKYHAWH